tara:strand:+ start:263 stop:490 length:228 start_codon:yes stop_codon:yes gene_type:complete
MDINLSNTKSGSLIEARSVHGILWLQTHFESKHWESISKGIVKIPFKEAQMLFEDGSLAGLKINFINALTQIEKI